MIVVECLVSAKEGGWAEEEEAEVTPSPNDAEKFRTHTAKVWKYSFLSFRRIPMSIVVTKENVAEAIYLLEV